MNKLLTPNEVAALVNVTRKTVLAWVRDKGLVAFKVAGTRWGIREHDLRKFIEGRKP